MKRMTFVLGVMMTLAMAAPADLIVVVDPGVDLGGGLISYTVHMVATDPDDELAAFDGSFHGTLNQIKYLGAVDTPTLDYASQLPAPKPTQDSHFLLWDADLIGTLPNETPSLLNGVFSVDVAAREQDLAFAQIVLPGGETAQLTGTASNAGGEVFDVSTTIPEPMTVSLLSVGVVFILRRRKPCQRRNASD